MENAHPLFHISMVFQIVFMMAMPAILVMDAAGATRTVTLPGGMLLVVDCRVSDGDRITWEWQGPSPPIRFEIDLEGVPPGSGFGKVLHPDEKQGHLEFSRSYDVQLIWDNKGPNNVTIQYDVRLNPPDMVLFTLAGIGVFALPVAFGALVWIKGKRGRREENG